MSVVGGSAELLGVALLSVGVFEAVTNRLVRWSTRRFARRQFKAFRDLLIVKLETKGGGR